MSDWKKIIGAGAGTEQKFETTEVKVVKNKKPYFGLNPKWVWTAISALAVITLIAILWILLIAMKVRNYNKVYPGVSVFGIDVGEMTFEEAEETVAAYSSNFFSDKSFKITCCDESVTVNVGDAMNDLDAASIARQAYDYGREKGLMARNRLIGAKGKTYEIMPTFSVNEEYVTAKVEELSAKVEKDFVNYKVINTGSAIEITRGQDGQSVDRAATLALVNEALNTGSYNDIAVEAVVKKAEPPDVDYLRSTIYVEPKNAYLQKMGNKNYTVVDETVGVDIDVERMRSDMASADWTYREYDFIYTQPITAGELSTVLFCDVLATYTTDLSGSTSGRRTNVSLAAKEVNGTILLPASGRDDGLGDEFSFNGVVGERTESLGYQNAKVFVNGEVVDGVGGGICQVSSTLYVAALQAGLEITERHNHVFSVGYVPLGQDATVQWGFLDFRFRNTTGYPVKILAEVVGDRLTVTLLGTNEAPDTEIALETEVLDRVDYETEYVYNPNLTYGTYAQTQAGQTGYTCRVYAVTYYKGAEVGRTEVNTTTYQKANQMIDANPLPW